MKNHLHGTADEKSPECPGQASKEKSVVIPPQRRIRCTPISFWKSTKRSKPSQLFLLVIVLGLITVAFIGWEVIESHLFPTMSTGLHHFLLTIRALLTTLIGCFVVYYLMHRQQLRLSRTAERLANLLESYLADPNTSERFENPHLRHCKEVLDCKYTECPMYDSPGERCWQVMALSGTDQDHVSPGMEIQKCHECDVYRLSCPDEFTELGESFNNLMFLLQEEAKSLGHMRAQMVEREKMASIGQLASGLAHEIGNPLSSISSIVQVLRRSGVNGFMTEQLNLIQTHIQRITGTVHQLGRLSRPGVDRWDLIDVGKALEETVLLISFDRRAGNVEIVFEPPKSLPNTYGLTGQLEQVFINLSLNALDAMPEGGVLTIKAWNTRSNIVVEIQDTGCGMSPEMGRRIFEPFFTTKEPGTGTGLGLSVSYGIVQKLRGTIEYSSTLGKGTVFTIYLPIMEKKPD
jgi:signal transduction histidine kinase